MTENPYATPKSEVQDVPLETSPFSEKEIEDIGLYFNMTLYFFGAMIVVAFLGSSTFSFILDLAHIAALYFLVKSLRMNRPWLYVLLSLLPVASLIALFLAIRRGSAVLKQAGKKIGLLGVKGLNLSARTAPAPSSSPDAQS